MNNKPAHEIRLGRIRATIWKNAGESGPRLNVTVSRLYRDKEGHWKDSTSFNREDLPLLAKVIDLAHTWAYQMANGGDDSEHREDGL